MQWPRRKISYYGQPLFSRGSLKRRYIVIGPRLDWRFVERLDLSHSAFAYPGRLGARTVLRSTETVLREA
jgi:hypothetical protein